MFLSIALATAIVLTAVELLPYAIAGHRVSRDAWWRVAPLLVVVAVFAAAIAYGFRTRRRWSRHVVMLLWSTIALGAIASRLSGDIPRDALVRALVQPAVLTLLCGWYFYRKRNVVEYFRSIARR